MLTNPGPGLGGLGAEDKLAFFRTYTSPLITISSSNLGGKIWKVSRCVNNF